MANLSDPNREQLAKVARALGELSNEVVFVGGSIVGLLITDTAARFVRPTEDVDVIIEVASYAEYQSKVGPVLRGSGLVECTDEGAPVCAWKVDGIRVDVMPTGATVLGFTNPWYHGAIATAEYYDIDGTAIRVIAAPYFLATKLVAFADRGESDYYASHDLEDILAIVDGRPSLVDEIAGADDAVRNCLVESFGSLLGNSDFANALPGHLEFGREQVVAARLRAIAKGLR